MAQFGLGFLAGQRHAVKPAAQLGQLLQARGGHARHIAPLGQFVRGMQQAPQGPHHAAPHTHLRHGKGQHQATQQERHLGPHAAVGCGVQVVQRHRQTHGSHGFTARLDEWLDRHQLWGAIRAHALALPLRGLQHQGAELAIGKRSPEIVC